MQGNMDHKPLIFAVEDDSNTRLLLEKAITWLGFSFEGFGRIADLKERMSERTPDVLVVDGLLPDGSGVELAREITQSGAFGRPKLVFFSAIFRDLRTRRYLEGLGVEAIVDKPSSILALREKIAGLLNIRILDTARAHVAATA